MNISYNWLKEYIPLTSSAEEVAEWLTQAGLEVTKMTSFVPIAPTLVVGETVSCVAHPNADKLKKVGVNIGEEKYLEIICGATNVASGQKVIVAPVGTTITSSDGTIHRIKRAKIRGEYSEGMICSGYEIGVSERPDKGILVLDTTRPAGTPATTYFSMPPDTIFEIDITPNMGNACSHLGIAREIAAMRGKALEAPITEPLIGSDQLTLDVEITDDELCPRYAGVLIKDIQIAPSPLWLRNRLLSIGIQPINNVVDITNFIMHALGQPLHAFDYDKIEGRKLSVGPLRGKAKMTTLHGEVLSLEGKEVVICDDKGPLCLAGIIGGIRAQVDQGTTRIFLESACFSPKSVTQSARKHNVHTEASFRFERGTDIEMPYIALQKAAVLIEKIARGTVASTPSDHYPEKAVKRAVAMQYRYINRLIGKDMPITTIHTILQRLNIDIQEATEEGFTALVPPYRTDVKRPADIVEEIVRIYGYKKILPKQYYDKVPYASARDESTLTYKQHIVHRLAAQGYHEIKTNALMSHLRLSEEAKQVVSIANPLSQSLDALRPSMLYTGLEVIAYNLNRGNNRLKLFEIGKVYRKKDKGYGEEERLALFLVGDVHEPHWAEKSRKVALHDLYTIVVQLLRYSGIAKVEAIPVTHEHYEQCITLVHEGQTYAHLGAISAHIREAVDIKVPVFFTEIPMDTLRKAKTKPLHYKPLPQTPAIIRDISLAIPTQTTYTSIVETISNERLPYDIKIIVKDVYEGKGLSKGEKSYTIRLTIQGKRTFKEEEISLLMRKLEKAFVTKLKAKIRV